MSTSPPFSDLVDAWISDKRVRSRRGVSDSTERAYRSDLTQLALRLSSDSGISTEGTLVERQSAALDRIAPCDLTDENLKSVFQQMIEDEMSPASRARLLSALRGLCKWLIRSGYLVSDPTIDFETPQSARQLPVALTDEQLSAVVGAAASPDERLRAHWPARDLALIGLLAGCGLRSGEVTSLTHSAIHRLEPYRVTVDGKGSKQRTVPLSSEVLSAVDIYLAERTDIDPTRIKPSTLVFVRRNGDSLNNQALQLLVANWLTAAGVPPPPGEKAHLFRHTYAVGQIDRGTSIAELRALLGHENISTTSQYLRLTADGLHHTARATAVNQLLTSRSPITEARQNPSHD